MASKNKEILFEAANRLKQKPQSQDEVNFRVLLQAKEEQEKLLPPLFFLICLLKIATMCLPLMKIRR